MKMRCLHHTRRWYPLVLMLLLPTGCDNYSHEAIVNTPPPNYINLLTYHQYGGDAPDYAEDLVALSGGGYAFVGRSSSYGKFDCKIYFAKLNEAMTVTDFQVCGGYGTDKAWSMLPDGQGGYLLVGETTSYDVRTGIKVIPSRDPTFGFSDVSLYLVKLDHEGSIEWERAIGELEINEVGTAAVVSGDGYLVIGVRDKGEAGSDLMLVRVTVAGETNWQREFTAAIDYLHTGIIPTSDGNFLLGGYGRYFGDRGRDPQFIKIDASGNVLWEYRYGWVSSDETIHEVIAVPDGFVACGSTERYRGTDSAVTQLYVLKTDLSGIVQWQERYEMTGINEGRAIVRKDDATFMVCGQNHSVSRIEACRITSDGQLMWSDVVGTGEARAMLTVPGGFMVAGSVHHTPVDVRADALVLKFTEDLTHIR